MGTFLLSFLVIALAVVGMSVGVLFGRAPIRGSCGGIANGGGGCTSCSRPCARERRRRARAGDHQLPG